MPFWSRLSASRLEKTPLPGARRIYALAVALPLCVIALAGILQPALRTDLGNLLFDNYQRWQPRAWSAQTPVRIVDIDDASLARLGQWPWPRTLLADLVLRLKAMGAAAVVFDIVLAEPDASSPEKLLQRLPDSPARMLLEREVDFIKTNDAVLAEAIATVPTVLGAILTQDASSKTFPVKAGVAAAGDDPAPFLPAFSGAVAPLEILARPAAGIGAANWLPDRDQIVRRVPLLLRLGKETVPSLSAEALRVAQGVSTFVVRSSNASGHPAFGAQSGVAMVRIGDLEIATDRQAELRVAYSRSEKSRFISAASVLGGTAADADFHERIILVGSSAAGLGDRRATPIDASVAGVEIQAQIIEQMIEGRVLKRPDWFAGAELVLALVLALLVALVLPLLPAWVSALGAAALVSALAWGSWYAFSRHALLADPVLPGASVVLTSLSCLVALAWHEQRQRRYVRDAFARYVSPAVVARLAEDPSRLALGGDKRTLTVMFCDIRGFTAITERFDPQRLTAFMNEYLTEMSAVVLDRGGTIDKYVGDALMAFWNAPLDDPAHALHAADAALAMEGRLALLNARWRTAEGFAELPADVRFGIGLATGPCLVGNFGSSQRFDYSALGDSVNVASRMQDATKFYRAGILADEATCAQSPDLAWLEADVARMRGKADITRVYVLAGDARMRQSPAFVTFSMQHGLMREAWVRGAFEEAAAAAVAAGQLAPERLLPFYNAMAQRCRDLQIARPADWTPVTIFPAA